MKLDELIKMLDIVSFTGDLQTEIRSVAYDSRSVSPGALFAAVRGLKVDGRRFVPQAVKAGAAAILADAPLDDDPGVPVITVPEIREGMTLAAAALYGRPAEALITIGVTGTNGKTTITYLLESILNRAGVPTGVLGTVNYRAPGLSLPASLTTPEGPDLQKYIAEMRDLGVSHLIMEVASHALELGRVAGCRFDAAVFTNLTQDHLDFHVDMETYFEAKKKLFTEYLTGTHLRSGPVAVINMDDEWGRKLAGQLGENVMTYSLRGQADVRAVGTHFDRKGLSAELATPAGPFKITTRLIGDFNLNNMLAAAATALSLGFEPARIIEGLTEAEGVPGRFERVGTKDDFLVLIDYSHTPDALSNALRSARKLEPRRLLAVFGCGGDRDKGKRPLMGQAAGRLSDFAVVTSDNPRTENPLTIIEEIETGMVTLGLNRIDPEKVNGSFPSGSYVVEPDRRSAIRLACRLMGPQDILVVAGKGHEDYQILGRERIHFDDREEARGALEMEGKL